MSESFWQEPYESLTLPEGTIYAQTFSPLWSHNLDQIRVYIKHTEYAAKVKVSIQYLLPDGTPAGMDMSAIIISWEHIPYGAYTNVRQRKMPSFRLVKGGNYAFLIETLDCMPTRKPSTRYQPPPSGYPRGKLIKSVDGGRTWDLSDHGDLLFSEFGDPPLKPTPYVPPFDHWSIDDYGACDYNTSSCIRIATTSPAQLTILISVEKPTPIEGYKTVRGVTTLCLDHYTFKVDRSYKQLEKNDSIYHTFHVKSLKEGEPYWFAFTATADFWPAPSTGPIFHKVHPEAPPFTTIKRPDAPGDWCQINWQIGHPCPNHYLNVNEATSDEEASLISHRFSSTTSYKKDLYNIPDLEPFDRPIEQVHITARWRRQGGYAYVHLAKIGIKVNGVEWWTSSYNQISTSYVNKHLHLYENPITALPWTRQEVNNLQIGVALRQWRGIGVGSHCRCTQLYCQIIHDCSAYE